MGDGFTALTLAVGVAWHLTPRLTSWLLTMCPLRHGGWWFNKKTDMHRKAAVGHGKKAYHYGKEYAKDKATELEGRSQATYDKARAQAQAKAEEADRAMKQTKVRAGARGIGGGGSVRTAGSGDWA